MKAKTIVLLLVVAATSASLYRHATLRAAVTVTSNTAEICNKIPNKLECNSDGAMIQNTYTDCTKACPSKTEWYNYCAKTNDSCEDDCELLNVDGKSAAKVTACKNECAKKEAECKASYRDKAQCVGDCETARQKAVSDFAQRWAPKK